MQTPEERRAYCREYRKKNLTYLRKREQKWRERNREKQRIAIRKYQSTPKGKFFLLGQRARARGISLGIGFEEYCQLISKPCFYCGGKLPPTGCGLDRLDHKFGYVTGNCVPCCCSSWNTAKKDGKNCNHIKGFLEAAGFKYPRTVELMFELLKKKCPTNLKVALKLGAPLQENMLASPSLRGRSIKRKL